MTPITDEIWTEMHFMEHLYNEACKFIDSMILYGCKPVTEDDIVWIVNCIGDSVYKDRLAAKCSLYSALHRKYIGIPKTFEQVVLNGYNTSQVFVDDFDGDVYQILSKKQSIGLPDNRETRRHGYNYAKETSYKKPNRRRPWE